MYGLIGEKLGHSFSKEIHEKLASYEYRLQEFSLSQAEEFFKEKNFSAVNVTIPYKQTVIPYLSYIDPLAKEIGAVNTVVNKGGELYGYNTDFYGMKGVIQRAKIEVKGKKAAILGTGGTSKTARAVLADLGAKEILLVSRKNGGGAIDYETLYEKHADTQIIVNTTPVGMYPNVDARPVDLEKFPSLSGVVDVVYNPLRTALLLQANERNIPCCGGLYMLVLQAVKAAELFLDKTFAPDTAEKIYVETLRVKQNIVLIGMPSSGKTTIARYIGEKLSMPVVDTDEEIKREEKREIKEIFSLFGEGYFREKERETIERVSKKTGCVIATGGGAVLNAKNIENLKRNGKIFFLDRPLQLLLCTADRPLSSTKESLKKRYEERYELYKKAADYIVAADKTVEEEGEEILKRISEEAQ